MAARLGLIDSHAHIQGSQFAGDLSEVLRRASEAGVTKIVVAGGAGSLDSNRAAVELAAAHPELFATVGVHPHDAKDVGEREIQELGELLRGAKVVAVGETGLDFHYVHSPRPVQIELFRRFISLARETSLPLVVHVREAEQQAAELLRADGRGDIRGVIHCFTGDWNAAKGFLDLGFYLSFSGIITFKNAEAIREVVRNAPLDRMLIETDSPYLTPVPHRGKRNEPCFVRLVGEMIAKMRGVSLEETARATGRNAEALFGI